MAIVFVIILVVIGMITQGSDKEKGCGWIIVACVAFLWFLIQLGISGDDAANIFLWIIGIGFIILIIWGISQSTKNNSSNQSKNESNTNKLECSQDFIEIKQDKAESNKVKETERVSKSSKYISEVFKNDEKDEDPVIEKNVVNTQLSSNVMTIMEKAKNEYRNCYSMQEVIDRYVSNRSTEDMFEAKNIAILKRYLVYYTDYVIEKDVYSDDLKKIITEVSGNKENIEGKTKLSKNKDYQRLVNSICTYIQIKKGNDKNESREVEKKEEIPIEPLNVLMNDEDTKLFEIVMEESINDSIGNYKPIEIKKPLDKLYNNPIDKNKIEMRESGIEIVYNTKPLKKIVEFNYYSDIHEYIREIDFGKKEKLVYIEPDTNITRFKKAELEYAEKIKKISDFKTERDDKSDVFGYFLQESISGDLRAIDKLSFEQLSNGYSIWVKLVNHGKLYYPTSSTYANVLIHQIVNRMIIYDEDWALVIMADLWNHYYPDFQHKEVLMWIKDFWVIYCTNISYEEFKKLFKYDIEFEGDNIIDAIDSIEMSYLENGHYLDFFNENSNYKIKTGRTVVEGQEALLEDCLKMSILRLQELFKNHDLKLEDYFQSKEITDIEKKRDPFRRLVILSETADLIVKEFERRNVGLYEVYTTELNDNLKMLIRRKRYTFSKSRLLVENIGKVCELFVRDWLGIPAKFIVDIEQLCTTIPELRVFKTENGNEIVSTIQSAVEMVCSTKGIEASEIMKADISHLRSGKIGWHKQDKDLEYHEELLAPQISFDISEKKKKFVIDISKLDKIRNDAAVLQERLIVDEYNYENEEVSISVANDSIDAESISENPIIDTINEWSKIKCVLDKSEVKALEIILNQESNEKLSELSRNTGILAEVLMESINDKALEVVGDVLIDSSGEQPVIFEEYLEEIEKLVQED